jgi:hypothetical protein
VTCTPGLTIVSGTLAQGGTLSQSGVLCTDGINAFQNFSVFGDAISAPISFSLTTGPNTNAGSLLQDFSYNNLGANDIQITYQLVPGVTGFTLFAPANTTVTQVICSVRTGPNGFCPPANVLSLNPNWTASNGGSSFSSVKLPPGGPGDQVDWVFQNVAAAGTLSPEPITFSLMGAGLLAIGILGRRFRR